MTTDPMTEKIALDEKALAISAKHIAGCTWQGQELQTARAAIKAYLVATAQQSAKADLFYRHIERLREIATDIEDRNSDDSDATALREIADYLSAAPALAAFLPKENGK